MSIIKQDYGEIGVSKEDFQFSTENYLYGAGPGGGTYTFTQAYKKCLVVIGTSSSSSSYNGISCSGCTMSSSSNAAFGGYPSTGPFGIGCMYIVQDITVGATISAPNGTAFCVYLMEE